MNLGGYTATGPRNTNEDNYYVVDFPEVKSFTNGVTSFAMVSDGMGGYKGGDVASGLAVSSAENYIAQLLEMAERNQIELDAEYALNEISQNAHDAIVAEARSRGGLSMGATFVGAFLSPTHAWIGHVGDSRAYLLRNGSAVQITEDHSQVGRMLSRGLITEEEAQNHPARNRIERALGFSDPTPEMNEIDLESGDALLLCSDGVYTVLDSAALGECVGNACNAENAATRIVKTALTRGTDDNSTAVVVLNSAGEPVQTGTGKRKAPPTIRTSAVGTPRHGTANRFRPENYRIGQRPSARQLEANKRSKWAIVLPVVVAAVLVAAIVGIFFSAGDANTGGGGSTDSEIREEATLSAGPTNNEGAQSTSTTALPSPEQSNDSETLYEVRGNAVLKYIDSDGIAHRFDEDSIGSILVNLGSSVLAASHADSYGQADDRSYQVLSSTYREALMRDRSQFLSGVSEFDSALSRIVDQDSYLRFIEEVANTYDNAALTKKIAQLALDESSLAPRS